MLQFLVIVWISWTCMPRIQFHTSPKRPGGNTMLSEQINQTDQYYDKIIFNLSSLLLTNEFTTYFSLKIMVTLPISACATELCKDFGKVLHCSLRMLINMSMLTLHVSNVYRTIEIGPSDPHQVIIFVGFLPPWLLISQFCLQPRVSVSRRCFLKYVVCDTFWDIINYFF